MIYWGVVFY